MSIRDFSCTWYPLKGKSSLLAALTSAIILSSGDTAGGLAKRVWLSRVARTYSIGHVTTGQFNLDRTGHSWLRHYFSDAYRDRLLAEAGEPIIRSTMIFISIKKRRGTARANRIDFAYSTSSPGAARMTMVHVFPVAQDLPNERKEAGYEELDFGLEDFGVGMAGTALQFVTCRSMTSLRSEPDRLPVRTRILGKAALHLAIRRELRKAANAMQRHVSGEHCAEIVTVAIVWNGSIQI